MLENKLLEIKARIKDVCATRKKLLDLKALYIGTFHQIDTYFNAPKGRLKVREIEGSDKAEIIYYERMDVSGPKRSDVTIIEVQKKESFKMFFGKILGKKIVVDKNRDIFRYKGTQIHLDIVQKLGKFIEFEREIKNLYKDQKILLELINKFELKNKDLFKGSYSDIILEKANNYRI